MKKLLGLLLASMLVFALVACSTGVEETPAEGEETQVEETTEESVEETETESTEETEAEEPKSVEVSLIALQDSEVLYDDGTQQAVVTLEAGNQTSLMQGHRYVYSTETPELTNPLVVESVEMLGKKIGFPVKPELIDEVIGKVAGAKVIDVRTAEEFAAGHIANSINISDAEVTALTEQDAEGTAVGEYLTPIYEQLSEAPALIVVGGTPEVNAAWTQKLYSETKKGIILDGGQIDQYPGELVTE